jgi:hypothetical protein
MASRAVNRIRPSAPPEDSLLGHFLDPIDRLSETLFALMILLSVTLAVRIGMFVGEPHTPAAADVNRLLIAIFSVIVGWGAIDGVMYVLFCVFDRGEKQRLLMRIQSAETPDAAIEAIAEKLDPILEPITLAGQRTALYEDVLAHLQDSHAKPVRVRQEDVIGGIGCVLVAVISVLPSLVPFLLFPGDFMLALRLSILVSFGMLFAAGWGYGHYSRMSPWKTGLVMMAAGGVLGLIALFLEK